MPGIARRGKDKARGVIIGPSAKTVFANGLPVSLLGDTVAPHGKPPHTRPSLVSNPSPSVVVENINVAKQGTLASCGHPVEPASPNVIVP